MHPRQRLAELVRKPQAVRQGAPELVEALGEPYGRRLWALLEGEQGPQEWRAACCGPWTSTARSG